jgi:hypothetical protein
MPQTFKLTSEFISVLTRPFPAALPADLDPVGVRPLVMGEFLQLDSAYKMERGGDNNGASLDPAAVPSYAVFSEQGDYAVQATGKVSVLYMHSYEADTMIFDPTGLTLGEKLEVVDWEDAGGVVRRGLGQYVAGHVVGHVTRLPANNNGWLRFMRTG